MFNQLTKSTFKLFASKPIKKFDWALFEQFVKKFGISTFHLFEDFVNEILKNNKIKPFAVSSTFKLFELYFQQHLNKVKSITNQPSFQTPVHTLLTLYPSILSRTDLSSQNFIPVINVLLHILQILPANTTVCFLSLLS